MALCLCEPAWLSSSSHLEALSRASRCKEHPLVLCGLELLALARWTAPASRSSHRPRVSLRVPRTGLLLYLSKERKKERRAARVGLRPRARHRGKGKGHAVSGEEASSHAAFASPSLSACLSPQEPPSTMTAKKPPRKAMGRGDEVTALSQP